MPQEENRMRKARFAAGIVILIFAGILIVRIRGSSDSTPERRAADENRGVAVRTVNSKRGDISASSSFVGEISGIEQATVYSEVPGRLRQYLAGEGQQVEKDRILAHVEREVTGMDYELHRVRSPLAGTLTRLYLSSGDTVTQQTPLAVVAKIDRVKASFYIPEREIAFIQKGNPVSLTVDAFRGRAVEGKINRISLSLDRESRAAYAEAVFNNPGAVLKPGMFARLEVTYSSEKDALLIPEAAVIREPGESRYIVFTAREGVAVKNLLKTGYIQNDKIHIISGLSENEMVIVEGQHFLEDGDKIRVIE